MQTIQRLAYVAVIALFGAVLAQTVASAFEDSAIQLSFNPPKDEYSRYMFQLAMRGAHISPGVKDEIAFGEYLIGTVFKDTCTDSLHGLNRHSIQFYEYNVRELNTPLGTDINDPIFGGNPWPPIPQPGKGGGGGGGGGQPAPPGGGGGGGAQPTPPGGGGGGGGGATGSDSGFVGPTQSGGFISGLALPSNGPLQGPGQGNGGGDGGRNPGGDNGGKAGKIPTSVNLDTILVTNLDYVTNKQGEVLDVGGLDMLRKVSENRLVTTTAGEQFKSYIDVNISHVFEWTHLLYLPTTPVYKEDIWFHSYAIHVPGLPVDQPILTKFMYKLVDFRRVGNRKVAVIDSTGIAEWNTEWNERTSDELTEFKSWGKMGFASRYWFDYERGMVFGIERPPFVDYQYGRYYDPIEVGMPYDGQFQLSYPGLIITLDMFYNTNVTDISNKPKLQKEPPKEQRRYISLNMLCQLEAE
jgi:hypothetical protein